MESKIINYLRLHLLNIKGSSPVIRDVIERIQQESVQSSLDDYLKCFQPMFLDLKNIKAITQESFDRLFPSGTIKTDINEWDITLLHIVLYHTCSIEGKLLTNLRHILKREVHSQTSGNTINAFLEKNKVKIERLKDTEITDKQYKTLFPDDSEDGSILETWDNELLTTIIFNLCKCNITERARCMVQEVVMREVHLYDQRNDLSTFLQIHEASITELKNKEKISELQFKKVYPETGVSLDINTWDDRLLCLVALTVCRTLPLETVKAVQGIKAIRNSLSHNGKIEVNHDDFLDKWTDTYEFIMAIIRESASHMTEQVKEIINGIIKGPLENKDAIKSLVNEYNKDPEENEKILDTLKTLETSLKTCIETSEERIIQHVSKQKEGDNAKVETLMQDVSTKLEGDIKTSEERIIQEFRKKIEDLKPRLHGKDVYIKDIPTKIAISTDDDEMTDLIGEYLKTSIEVAAELKEPDEEDATSSDNPTKDGIRKLTENLKRNGIRITAVKTGSIILVLQCSSLESLACLLKLYQKGILKIQLNAISDNVSSMFGCEIHLEAAFDDVDWKSVLDDMEKQLTLDRPTTKGSSQKAVELTLKTKSVDGLRHIWETFTKEDTLKELSKELALKMGKDIHLESSVDIDAFNDAIVSLEEQLLRELSSSSNISSDSDIDIGMRGHMLREKAGMEMRGSKQSPKCTIHLKELEFYCGNHDVACCQTCISTNHGSCTDVDSIPHVTAGIMSRKEVNQVKDNMTRVQLDLGKMKKLKQDYLKRNELDKSTNLKQIDDFREDVVKHLDDLVEKSKHEVKTKHAEIDDKINYDIQSLNDMISTLEESAKHIETRRRDSEVHFFLHVKHAKNSTTEGDKLLNEIKTDMEKLTLIMKTELKDYTRNLKSIYDINITRQPNRPPSTRELNRSPAGYSQQDRSTTTRPVTDIRYRNPHYNYPGSSAKLRCECKVRVKGDNKCFIQGCCILEDGSLVITDYNNKKLKLYDREYKAVDQCELPSPPWGVCSVGHTEVAVTLQYPRLVQLVSTKNYQLRLTRSFNVGADCMGIAFSQGELFVTAEYKESAQVLVYSLAGNQLRTLQNDTSGQPLFTLPRGITCSNDGTNIHVADIINGLVTVDRQGCRQSMFTDPGLQDTQVVCVLPNDDVLVNFLTNIVLLDKHGKKSLILTVQDGIKDPRALCYDRERHRLIVTMQSRDTINVYDLV